MYNKLFSYIMMYLRSVELYSIRAVLFGQHVVCAESHCLLSDCQVACIVPKSSKHHIFRRTKRLKKKKGKV